MIRLFEKAIRWRYTYLVGIWTFIVFYVFGVIAAWNTRPHKESAIAEFFLSFLVGMVIPIVFVLGPIIVCAIIAAFEALIRETIKAIKER